MNFELEAFKYQKEEYKMTILYLLKNVNEDIKEIILNLVDLNLENEMIELDYFGEIISGDYNYSESHIDWFYESDWSDYFLSVRFGS